MILKYYEYYTDDLSFSITDDDVKEGDYVTATLENVAVLNQLNGKDVTYEGVRQLVKFQLFRLKTHKARHVQHTAQNATS